MRKLKYHSFCSFFVYQTLKMAFFEMALSLIYNNFSMNNNNNNYNGCKNLLKLLLNGCILKLNRNNNKCDATKLHISSPLPFYLSLLPVCSLLVDRFTRRTNIVNLEYHSDQLCSQIDLLLLTNQSLNNILNFHILKETTAKSP